MRYKNQLGCITWPALVVTIVTIFVISGIVFAEGDGLFSPGELNAIPGALLGNIRSHVQISRNCDQCHTAPWDADFMQDRCVRCHANIQQELSDSHQLHGILLNHQSVLACSNCHPEHRGPYAPLTDARLDNFPHDLLGFATTAHKTAPNGAAFICQDCHLNGYKTFKTSDCADCHQRLDQAFMTAHISQYAPDCRTCHDGKESMDKHFDHAKTAFMLVGAHTGLACARCHTGAHQLADFKTSLTRCSDCHLKDNPHTENLGIVCENCHTEQGWNDAHFDHALTGFTLTGSHENVACEKCHAAFDKFQDAPTACVGCHQQDDKHVGSEGPLCETCHITADWKTTTFNHDVFFKLLGAHTSATCVQCHTMPFQFKNTPTTCFGCHQKDDRHAGSEGQSCDQCHTLSSWKPSTFNHDSANFRLTGAHTRAACSRCHTVPNMFRGTPMDCVSCHLKDDAHAGSLGTACGNCHFTASWKPSSFDHNTTAFKLTGLHATTRCAQCHLNADFKGTPSTCFGCHQKDDKHAGTAGTSCENCHAPTGWKPSTFVHSKVFALTGKHDGLSCLKCHTTPNQFNNAPATCFGCHQKNDAHAGTEGTACANCHATSGWKPSIFNHNTSTFPLTGAHTNAACAKCHTILGLFRGTPRDCYSCHAKDDHHAGAFGTNCSLCHTTTAWKPSTFDHSQSSFPLTGAHKDQPCGACHAGGVFQGTPSACANCHGEPAYHAGLFGVNCAACHSTSNWNATYSGPHTFPMRHGDANGNCATCHPSTLARWTCFNCHNQSQTAQKHAEKGILEITNCVGCHPTGKKD